MRMTQYIGLNDYAKNLVKNALKVETNPKMTSGMFDEDVAGRIYHMPPPSGPNKALIYREELQDSPWSSGPMLFTHLRGKLIKESDQEVDIGCVCSWIVDPGVRAEHGEYDEKTGRYYV